MKNIRKCFHRIGKWANESQLNSVKSPGEEKHHFVRNFSVEQVRFFRRELGNLMLKRKNEIDVKLLRFAIEKTVAFETVAEKKFPGKTFDHATNPITNYANGKLFKVQIHRTN